MKKSLNFIAVASTLILLSCTTPGKVVVRSKPESASVYFLDGKSGQSALVGKTPLTFDRSTAKQDGNDLIQLRIEKDGFEPRYAAVTAFGQETTFLDLTLQQPMIAKGEVRAAFEESRKLMEETNRLLLNKRYSEALMSVEKMLQLDPKNAEAHAAKGSVLYLMKDYDGASSSWTHALELNPAFDNVRESLIHLTNERPSRGAASVGGN
jgi:hypothetical protein